MRRFTMVTLLGFLLMMTGAIGGTSMSAGAEGLTQTDVPTIVGSWQVMGAGAPGTPSEDPMLATFSPNGNVTLSARAVRPALPGMPFAFMHFSTGHGSWEDSQNGVTSFTVVHLRSDETGVFRGTVTFSGTVMVESDGQTVLGDGTYTVRDPSGAVQSTISTSLEGERIVVEPLEQSATLVASAPSYLALGPSAPSDCVYAGTCTSPAWLP